MWFKTLSLIKNKGMFKFNTFLITTPVITYQFFTGKAKMIAICVK